MEHFAAYADSDEENDKKEVEEKPTKTIAFSLVQYGNEEDDESKQDDSNSNVRVHINTPTYNLTTGAPPSPRIETVIDVDIQAPESKPVPVENFISLLPPDVPSLDDMLPPKPTSEPDPRLTEKLNRFHQLRDQGKSINANLVGSHAFKNPDILEKLVQYMGVSEIGSNYPKTLFNPIPVDDSDYYDNLAKAQNAYYDKDAAKTEQAPAPTPQTSAPAPAKSKSKWDVVEEENKRELPPSKPEPQRRDNRKGEEEPSSAYAEYIKKKQAEAKEGFNKKPRKS